MKHVLVPVVSGLMILIGAAFGLDLVLALCGVTNPVVVPEFGMHWQDSAIFHYNVSNSANVLIGMLSGMAIFSGVFLITQSRLKT